MIRFFNPGLQWMKYEKELLSEYQRIRREGRLILQEETEIFERNFARFVGTRFAVGVSSGTDALYLIYKALGIGPGDEVITVSNTFKATITTIIQVGAKPILIDIDDKYLIDINKIEDKITDKTKAIVPVHLSGDMPNMMEISQLARENDIYLIEDACQALGSEYGKPAGSWGIASAFSFYPAKILGCGGDGGAVVTNDPEIADEIREMRNHYKTRPGGQGGNYRLDNIHAAELNIKLKYLPQIIQRRKEIAEMYKELEKFDNIILPHYREKRVWQDYVIRTSDRDYLYEYLKNEEVETMIPPVLPHEEFKLGKLPKSEKYNKQFLRLPCNDVLENWEVERVIELIKNFYAV